MSLGKKIAILFLVLGVAFSLGSYGALKLTIFPAFGELELQSAAKDLSRVNGVLNSDIRALEIVNVEYSIWDQTYAYALGQRPEYPRENLDPAYWHSVDIHMMMLFDARGELLTGSLWNPDDFTSLDVSETLAEPLTPGHKLVRHDDVSNVVKGLWQTRRGLMLVVAYPILDSEGGGPIAGSFIVGQFLTEELVADIAEVATANVQLHSTMLEETPPRVAAATTRLTETDKSSYIDATDVAIHSYELLHDIYGKPVGVLEVFTPRKISDIGNATIRAAGLSLAAASAIFLITALVFMQHSIIDPVKRLTDKILGIQETGDLSVELGIHGNDEVGVLAKEFGALTQRLGKTQGELEAARDEALDMASAKSEFLARMSHEIRTPMNGVLGMTELLRNTQLEPKQQRFVETIYDSAGNLLQIINDILDFSKIEAGKLQLESVDVNLRDIVEDTLDSLADQAHQKNLELTAAVPMEMPMLVRSDPVRLRQVLTNLLGNAIKFTQAGEVNVRLAAYPQDDGRVDVRFEIEDTGVGIADEKKSIIFDSFTQEDGTTTRLYGGTGLGLAICSQIVDLMGGVLEVESESGVGSNFFFTLTLDIGTSSLATATGKPVGVAGKRVLIVDDNATNLEILESQLESWHAETNCVASGKAALEALLRSAEWGSLHDLAILDMHMPHMDGLQLARAIRAEPSLSSLRLIILSSVATPATEALLNELNISGQLTKPVRQSQLYDSMLAVFSGEKIVAGYRPTNSAIARSLSGKVLLAEDNPVNQAVAIGMLEHLGLSVDIAENGEEAVNKAARDSYDAVLMDCQMPVLDGFEASKQIRNAEKGTSCEPIPIIAVTANALKGDREACLAAGMNEYLSKPFTSEQLHSVLGLFLPSSPWSPMEAQFDAEDAANEAAHSAPIDRSALDVLAGLQKAGAPSILEQVIDIYQKNSQELTEKLRDGVATDDSEKVREAAHALKSSSNNVGANRLAELCRQLESMARENSLELAASALAQLLAEHTRVTSALAIEMESAVA